MSINPNAPITPIKRSNNKRQDTATATPYVYRSCGYKSLKSDTERLKYI